MSNNIYITKSFLPPIEEYNIYLNKIWNNGQLTNQGPLLKEFEAKARNYLGVDNFHFVSNGTSALQLSLNALGITDGEIITTPFSYVATTSSILWERCNPVFCDINPNTLCIDADKIEGLITDKTKAIMPVHVFGIPCDVDKIGLIAKKHHLKVIYDGAHAFGVKYREKSLLSYGDISTCSFHSTKLMHTIEGGCIILADKDLNQKVDLIKRFGHNVDDHIMLGINAKASEFQAAMGLCNIKYIEDIISRRKIISNKYTELLSDDYIKPVRDIDSSDIVLNYSYYPIIFKTEAELIKKLDELNKNNIFPRRYFYPSLNTLSYISDTNSCPVSEDISRRVICLPLYDSLSLDDVVRICKILNEE